MKIIISSNFNFTVQGNGQHSYRFAANLDVEMDDKQNNVLMLRAKFINNAKDAPGFTAEVFSDEPSKAYAELITDILSKASKAFGMNIAKAMVTGVSAVFIGARFHQAITRALDNTDDFTEIVDISATPLDLDMDSIFEQDDNNNNNQSNSPKT